MKPVFYPPVSCCCWLGPLPGSILAVDETRQDSTPSSPFGHALPYLTSGYISYRDAACRPSTPVKLQKTSLFVRHSTSSIHEYQITCQIPPSMLLTCRRPRQKDTHKDKRPKARKKKRTKRKTMSLDHHPDTLPYEPSVTPSAACSLSCEFPSRNRFPGETTTPRPCRPPLRLRVASDTSRG